MKDKTLPYFLTISLTVCQIKIFNLAFFPVLKSFILLPSKQIDYGTNYLATVFFKIIQYGYESFQNVN